MVLHVRCRNNSSQHSPEGISLTRVEAKWITQWKLFRKTGCAQEVRHTSLTRYSAGENHSHVKLHVGKTPEILLCVKEGPLTIKLQLVVRYARVFGLNAMRKRRHRTEIPPPPPRKVGSVCERPDEQGGIKRTLSPINWRRGRQRRCGGAQAHRSEREAERCWGIKGKRLTGPWRASLTGIHRRPWRGPWGWCQRCLRRDLVIGQMLLRARCLCAHINCQISGLTDLLLLA